MRKPLLLVAFAFAVAAAEPKLFLRGVAVDALTERELEGVTIRTGQGALITSTAADGTFRLGLKAGDYTVHYEKPGYIGTNYGTVPPSRVQVSAGGESSLRIELAPAASLSGRVLGEEGEPVPGLFIYARAAGDSLSSIMDETARDGSFRLEHLSPGPYKIELRIPESLRRSKNVVVEGVPTSYLPVVWYPGVNNPDAAAPMILAAGQHLSGFDFRLRRFRLAALNIRVTDGVTKAAVPGVDARLRAIGDPDWTDRKLNAAGQARFDLIPPGQYELALYAGDPARTLPFVKNVFVTSPAAEADVSMPQFQPITGHLVGPFRHPVLLMIGTKSADIASDGSFQMFAPPGEWRVRVRPSLMEPEIYVAQVRWGKQDALTGPIVTNEIGNPELEIVLADGARRISGQVLDADDKPVARARVACAAGGQTSMTLTDQKGYFQLGNLKPGEYEVEAGKNCSGSKIRIDLTSGDAHLNSLRPCKSGLP